MDQWVNVTDECTVSNDADTSVSKEVSSIWIADKCIAYTSSNGDGMYRFALNPFRIERRVQS